MTVRGARQHNLKNLDVRLPLGLMVCITGVSGSGKSTLVGDVIYAGIKKQKSQWKGEVGKFDSIEGAELVEEILLVDQSPIGKSPRSNPVTYLKAFDEIRRIFALQRASQRQNLRPGHFSFNIPGGRCETCDGAGFSTVNMQFLADVELMCEDCRGRRYKSSILEIGFQGKNIAQVLDLTVTEALEFFRSYPRLSKKLKVLEDVGLGYVKLGQSSTTLSGGEAQRIKLASYLAKSTRSDSIFILDEPTTGLHFDDIQKLLRALDRLISKQATVVIIEHNMDVIRSADWVIDLGPEGGDKGGYLVAEGTPENHRPDRRILHRTIPETGAETSLTRIPHPPEGRCPEPSVEFAGRSGPILRTERATPFDSSMSSRTEASLGPSLVAPAKRVGIAVRNRGNAVFTLTPITES